MNRCWSGWLLAGVLVVGSAWGDVKPAWIFQDNMVLQRDRAVPVWGTGSAGESVSVNFGAQSKSDVVDANGQWQVRLAPLAASDMPQEMRIVSGTNVFVFTNVVVGDVWVCSGQSNMEFPLWSCEPAVDVAAANDKALRVVKVPWSPAAQAGDAPEMSEKSFERNWRAADGKMTGVGYYFARKIRMETGIPVGLIDANWGGTAIELWVPPCGLQQEPGLAAEYTKLQGRLTQYMVAYTQYLHAAEAWVPVAQKMLAERGAVSAPPVLPEHPVYSKGGKKGWGSLYNGMIHPVLPYAIKGAIWYQGEANGSEGESYFHKMRALVNGWRQVWDQGDFPFYYVQLTSFMTPTNDPAGGDGWSRLREAQARALAITNTAMAVTIDVGEADDIHPKNKLDVGERLARWALVRDYGVTNLVAGSPMYCKMAVEGDKVRVFFDDAGSGLMAGTKNKAEPVREDVSSTLRQFAVAGADRKWHWADARIDGSTVVVASTNVPAPVAVRYAYSMNPAGANLYNRAGLPAAPFRTDDW
jgi:sialate O-acetylesterase